MVRPLLSPRAVTQLKRIRQRGFATIEEFWEDSYIIWKLDRPAGSWDDGTFEETWLPDETGMGKLKGIGSGNDQGDGDVIYLMSPYQFRLLAVTSLTSNDLIVVNGTRVFHVDSVTIDDVNDRLAMAHLQERFGDAIPEMVMTP